MYRQTIPLYEETTLKLMSELAAASEGYTSSMNQSWLAFLQSKSGEIGESQRTVFPHFQQEIPNQYVIPCTQESVICFEGKDAESFLQNQTTCDINDLVEGRFLFGAYCNPKGRVLATFRLYIINGAIYMVCHHSIVTSLLERLKMFVLRADVAFRIRPDLAVMCLNKCAELGRFSLLSWCQTGPAWPKECYGDSESTQPAQLIVVPVSDAIQLIEESEEDITLLDSDYWNLLQIRHGVASITASTSDLFTPQNLNLDLISGVSFTKGCYPGQEIVARLRYLGRVKQRLLRGRFQDECEVRVGQSVTLVDRTDSKAGVIVNASALEGVTTECLLSVHGFLEAENVFCSRAQPSKQITTLPLPYSLQ